MAETHLSGLVGGGGWGVGVKREPQKKRYQNFHLKTTPPQKKKSLRATFNFQELKAKVKLFHQTWRKEDISNPNERLFLKGGGGDPWMTQTRHKHRKVVWSCFGIT